MSFLIIGANGNFSSQLQEILMAKDSMVINKDIYGDWENFDSKLHNRLADISQKFNFRYLINTVGIVSKRYSPDFIRHWNFLFPKYLYNICQELGLILVTLGSIHENIPKMCRGNPYLESKKELEQFLMKNNFENSVHFQIHTWYGGRRVHPEMFLGQIIDSVKNKTVFDMSDGRQLREYHHVFDDAVCLLKTLQKDVRGAHSISHGEILTLEEIAFGIFQYFGCEDLLKLDTIKSSRFDVRDKSYLVQRNSSCSFRPTMKGLFEYVEKNI
jgi:nucleoside-diphosphate-sugar epimerase